MDRWLLVLLLATASLAGCVDGLGAGDRTQGGEDGAPAQAEAPEGAPVADDVDAPEAGGPDVPGLDDLPETDVLPDTEDVTDTVAELQRPLHAAADLEAWEAAEVLHGPGYQELAEALEGTPGFLGLAPDLSGAADVAVAFEGEAPPHYALLTADLSVRLVEDAPREQMRSGVTGIEPIDAAEAEARGILPLPEDAVGIGPGSPILQTIPGDGTYLCTANFIFEDAGTYYLGAAGHCFLPSDRIATHGPGADYNASGVTVQVCVDFCHFGGYMAGFWGDMESLGGVAYARQTGPGGQVGNDFGLVEIPPDLLPLVRTTTPMWSGPSGQDGTTSPGDPLTHYGNGIHAGSFVASKGRAGGGLGHDGASWQASIAVHKGDSGSPILHAGPAFPAALSGTDALGLITHRIAAPGVPMGWGTTIGQAQSMAGEAGLTLALVHEGQGVGG